MDNSLENNHNELISAKTNTNITQIVLKCGINYGINITLALIH